MFPRSAPSSPDVSPQSSPRPPRANNDRLTLLTRLVRKGEKKGLFVEKMPASIYQVKWHQALQAVKEHGGHTEETFSLSVTEEESSLTLGFISPSVFHVDGERRESQVHEEQRRLQQRLLQLRPLPGLRQCSTCFYCQTETFSDSDDPFHRLIFSELF